MTYKISDCGWAQYGSHSGPAMYAHNRFVAKGNDFLEKVLAVTSATEGAFSSVNFYDGAFSVGIIQWIDIAPNFKVCDMLGAAAEACGIDYILTTLEPALKLSNATFKQNNIGRWRFFVDGGNTEVTTLTQQQKLYLSCSGQKDSWTPATMLHAKTWCAAMASVWQDPKAQQSQVEFTKPKLMNFVFGGAKALFDDNIPDTGWEGMLKAACISYCVNSPVAVGKAVLNVIGLSKFKKWSPPWCLDVLHAITFAGINTFQARYNLIRPVLETQFGIILPKTTTDLAKREWLLKAPEPIVEPIASENPELPSLEQPVITHEQIIDAPIPLPEQPITIHETQVKQNNNPYKVETIVHWLVLIFGFWAKACVEIVAHFKK